MPSGVQVSALVPGDTACTVGGLDQGGGGYELDYLTHNAARGKVRNFEWPPVGAEPAFVGIRDAAVWRWANTFRKYGGGVDGGRSGVEMSAVQQPRSRPRQVRSAEQPRRHRPRRRRKQRRRLRHRSARKAERQDGHALANESIDFEFDGGRHVHYHYHFYPYQTSPVREAVFQAATTAQPTRSASKGVHHGLHALFERAAAPGHGNIPLNRTIESPRAGGQSGLHRAAASRDAPSHAVSAGQARVTPAPTPAPQLVAGLVTPSSRVSRALVSAPPADSTLEREPPQAAKAEMPLLAPSAPKAALRPPHDEARLVELDSAGGSAQEHDEQRYGGLVVSLNENPHTSQDSTVCKRVAEDFAESTCVGQDENGDAQASVSAGSVSASASVSSKVSRAEAPAGGSSEMQALVRMSKPNRPRKGHTEGEQEEGEEEQEQEEAQPLQNLQLERSRVAGLVVGSPPITGGEAPHDQQPPVISKCFVTEAGVQVPVEDIERLRRIFEVVDRDHSGRINVREMIIGLRHNNHLCALLHLPSHIHQEDGTRTVFERIFQAMDNDEVRAVTFDQFVHYVINHQADERPPLLAGSPSATPLGSSEVITRAAAAHIEQTPEDVASVGTIVAEHTSLSRRYGPASTVGASHRYDPSSRHHPLHYSHHLGLDTHTGVMVTKHAAMQDQTESPRFDESSVLLREPTHWSSVADYFGTSINTSRHVKSKSPRNRHNPGGSSSDAATQTIY